MPHDDALVLIAQEAARKDVSIAPEDQEQLWQRTGGVPLAIVWSVGLMGLGGSVESVLRRLGSGQSDIARFCFEESVSQVRGRDSERLLLALSLFATDASREALGVSAGLGEDEFGRVVGLEDLLRLSLINQDGDRFSLLPLTRSYVQSNIEAHKTWFEDARERWVHYFDTFVERFSGWSMDWRGHDLVEKDLINIFAVFNSLVTSLCYEGTNAHEQVLASDSLPQARMLIRLGDRVSRTLRVRGYWSDCERLALTAIPVSRSVDTMLTGWLAYTLARIYYYRQDLEAARSWNAQALEEGKKSGLQAMSSRAQLLLALIELHSGHLEEADSLMQTALQEAQRLGTPSGLSNILSSMGDLALLQGELAIAASHFQQAIELARQRNDVPKLAAHFLGIGKVAYAADHPKEAQTYFEDSLKFARECGLAIVIGEALYHTAMVEHALGDAQSATAHTREALDIFRRLGVRREQAEAEVLLAKLAEGSPNHTQDQ
jgi:tetratricopeptide (TPR) repeat protein